MGDISTGEILRIVRNGLPFNFGTFQIEDDGVMTITPDLQSGILIISLVNTPAGSQGLFAHDVDSGGASCVLGSVAADLAATTGVLTGTTGTDGKFTVSAHTDGKLYLENRLGSQKNIHWFNL